MMEKLDFMLGNWHLDYQIPKSKFSEAETGTGIGLFKRVLDGRYVTFDYSSSIDEKQGQAHAIFAWDEKMEIYINRVKYPLLLSQKKILDAKLPEIFAYRLSIGR